MRKFYGAIVAVCLIGMPAHAGEEDLLLAMYCWGNFEENARYTEASFSEGLIRDFVHKFFQNTTEQDIIRRRWDRVRQVRKYIAWLKLAGGRTMTKFYGRKNARGGLILEDAKLYRSGF
jgi:hypothetical protein